MVSVHAQNLLVRLSAAMEQHRDHVILLLINVILMVNVVNVYYQVIAMD